MNETKFTPGPWVAEQPSGTTKWGIYCDDATGSIVAELGAFAFARRPADEDAANARLIAAAPEMYAALKAITPPLLISEDLSCHRGVCPQLECAHCRRIAAAHAALARAGKP